tara:strand:- start:512 stop:2551 length:2040 start_codon:yes stop_codon:yes gene_type:complete
MGELVLAVSALVAAVSAAYASAGIIGQIALSIALSIGATLLQRALQKTARQPAPEDVQQSVRQGVQPRIRHYGRVKASGPWLFGGTHTGDFHKVIAIAHGEIDAIESFWADDNEIEIDGSGFVNADPYNAKLKIEYTLGTAAPTAFSDLVTDFTEYTSAHVGKGIALLYAKQYAVSDSVYFETFPNGINTVYLAVLRGTKILNPKTAVTEWDDNAASVILDYAKSVDGMRLPSGIFTTTLAQAMWEDAFDDCADSIPLKAGGTEERYRIWGSHSLEERPADVIGRLLAACDGRIVPTSDGGVGLKIGQYYEPTVILDEDHIESITELSRGVDAEQRPNTIRATFLNPDNYQSGDADPWVDATDVTARGSEVRDISLLMVPSHAQVRRLMKLEYYRANPGWVGRFSFNKAGLAMLGERLVRIQIADFGIDDVFEIQSLEFNFGEGGILSGCTADLIAMPEAAWTWNQSTEEGTAPIVVETTDGTAKPTTSGFDVTIIGGANPYALVEFDDPGDPLSVGVRYKATASTEWLTIPVELAAVEAQSPILVDGTEYEFQIRYVSIVQSFGGWSSSITRTVEADGVAPAVVTGVSIAAGAAGEADLNWTTPNSANFDRAVITRHTANVEGSATEITYSPVYGSPNIAVSFTDTGLAAGSYYYWIYASNGSGVISDGVATGVVTVT